MSNSLEGQVGQEGDSEEDGGNPTSDVSDEGEDGSLQLVSKNLSGDVLYKKNHTGCVQIDHIYNLYVECLILYLNINESIYNSAACFCRPDVQMHRY